MKKIVAIGEVLWDMLPSGKQVGGAPGNFAFHCRQLGTDGRMISRIGNDDLGRELLDFFRQHDVPLDSIEIDENHPTGTVGVELIGGQPKYTIFENVAWDRIEANEIALAAVKNADAVCFGSLASRSEYGRNNIIKLIDAAPKTALRVLDINLCAPFYAKPQLEPFLDRADILKLNDEEMSVISQMFGCPENGDIECSRWFMKRYDYRLIALTRGAAGSVLLNPDEISEIKTEPIPVVDTVGAGDSFTAQTIVGLLEGLPLKTIHAKAHELARFICTRPGAMWKHPGNS